MGRSTRCWLDGSRPRARFSTWWSGKALPLTDQPSGDARSPGKQRGDSGSHRLPGSLQGGVGREARQSCKCLAQGPSPRPPSRPRSAGPCCAHSALRLLQAHRPFADVSKAPVSPHTPHSLQLLTCSLNACPLGPGALFPGARVCLCPQLCVTYLLTLRGVFRHPPCARCPSHLTHGAASAPGTTL